MHVRRGMERDSAQSDEVVGNAAHAEPARGAAAVRVGACRAAGASRLVRCPERCRAAGVEMRKIMIEEEGIPLDEPCDGFWAEQRAKKGVPKFVGGPVGDRIEIVPEKKK